MPPDRHRHTQRYTVLLINTMQSLFRNVEVLQPCTLFKGVLDEVS